MPTVASEIAYIHTVKNPRRAALVRRERSRRSRLRVFHSIDGESDWDVVAALLHAEGIRVHGMPRNVRGKYGRWASLIAVWSYIVQHRVPSMTLVEDDVPLPDDFEAKLGLLLDRIDLRTEVGKLGTWGEGWVFSEHTAAAILDRLRRDGIDTHSDLWLRRNLSICDAPILTATVPPNARRGHIWHTTPVTAASLVPTHPDAVAAARPVAGYFPTRDDHDLAGCVRRALLPGSARRSRRAAARRTAVDPSDVIHVFFRACDRVTAVNGKARPFGFAKDELMRICFRSLLEALEAVPHRITIVGDRLSDDSISFFRRFPVEILDEDLGPGDSVLRCLDLALALPDDAWVYVCEDDYLHRADAFEAIAELVDNREQILRHRPRARWRRWLSGPQERRPLFIYPADQPTTYKPKRQRPSLLFRSGQAHWRQLTVAPFTFLTEVASLRRFERSWRRYGARNADRSLSRRLFGDGYSSGRALCVAPIPALASHMHVDTMSPGVDWARRITELTAPPIRPARMARPVATAAAPGQILQAWDTRLGTSSAQTAPMKKSV